MDTRKRKRAQNDGGMKSSTTSKTTKKKSKTQPAKKSTKRSGRPTPTATFSSDSSESEQEYEVLSSRKHSVVSVPKPKGRKTGRAITKKKRNYHITILGCSTMRSVKGHLSFRINKNRPRTNVKDNPELP